MFGHLHRPPSRSPRLHAGVMVGTSSLYQDINMNTAPTTRACAGMTRQQEIAAAREALAFARAFRAGIAELTTGAAKQALLARADAVIANGEMVVARLEHPSAAVNATLPQPAGVQ